MPRGLETERSCQRNAGGPTPEDFDAENSHGWKNTAEAPTQAMPLFWSTPIIAPRPARTMQLTKRSSSNHRYMIRISMLVMP